MALYAITLDPVPDGLPDEAPEARDRPPTVDAASAKINRDTVHDTKVRLPERLQRLLRLAATTEDTGENRCQQRRAVL